MASETKRGRFKRKLNETSTPSVAKFFKNTVSASINPEITSATIAASILDEIVDLCVNNVEKLRSQKKHTSDSVSVKTITSWKSKFPWLIIVEGEGSESRLKCRICSEQNVRSIWSEVGSNNFQKNSIQRHSESSEHQKAEQSKLKDLSVTTTCDSEPEVEVKVSENDTKLFRTVYYAAKEELPSSQINNLLQLQTLNGVELEYQNLSWDSIKEIQSCISTIFVKDIVAEMIQSDVFAVMIDESTDLTVEKHLSICVKYVKDGVSVTHFLSNVAVEDGKAHTIVNRLIECLTKLGLDPSKLVSLATDGAATMTGKKTGVGVQMKSKHSPFVIQTHCIAHRLNLAVTDSMKKMEALVKFKEKFNSLYHFMSGSSNRTLKLKKIQELLGEPSLTVKEPHSIRWLGLKNAVEAVYESYGAVLATLSCFAADKNAVAHGLHKYFADYKMVLLVAFMLDVHEILGVLSKELQKEDISFSELQPLMEGTLGRLEFIKSNDGLALKGMRNTLEIREEDDSKAAYLNGDKLKRYSDNVESELLTLRGTYINALKKNIEHRFRKDDSDMFHNFSLLLEPAVVNAAEEGECEQALEVVGLCYGVNKTVKTVHGDMIHANIVEEEREVTKLLNREKLHQEWPMVREMIAGSYRNKTTKKLCNCIIQLHSNAMPEFAKLCKIALCISVTSVACERSFSTQNRVKNKYRSSIKAENLDVLIQIQMAGQDLSTYNPTKAVRLWTSIKNRRKSRLCQGYKARVKKSTLSLPSSSSTKC